MNVRIWKLLLPFLLLAGGAAASDIHLELSQTRVMCGRSAFFHGYLHGYEEGFHGGNLDFQFGRTARSLDHMKEARQVSGYRSEFGNKHFFERGYHQGFKVGYSDAVSGRSFRAIIEAEQALGTGAHSQQAVSGAIRKVFDEGFSTGYKVGQDQGLADARNHADYQQVISSDCNVLKNRFPGGWEHEFCDGFGSGYRLGYSDGYTNQRPEGVETARHATGQK